MTSAVITKRIGKAMATLVQEKNQNPARLLERLQEQQIEIDRLKAQIEHQRQTIAQYQHAQPDEPEVQKVLQHDGRPLGNQSALARALHIGADRVSKWHKQKRLQVFVDAVGIEWFYLDQGKPPRKRRGS